MSFAPKCHKCIKPFIIHFMFETYSQGAFAMLSLVFQQYYKLTSFASKHHNVALLLHASLNATHILVHL